MKNKSPFIYVVLAVLGSTATWSGCGDSAPQRNSTVQGTVTIDGELANRGTVTFHPEDGGPVAVGQIDSNGGYSLSTGRGHAGKPDQGTVYPGKYVVTVMVTALPDKNVVIEEGGPPAAGPRLVAEKFIRKETSELKFEIKPGRNLCVLNLEGAEPNLPVDEQAVEEQAGEKPPGEASSEEASSEEASEPDADSTIQDENNSEAEANDPSTDTSTTEEETAQ